MSPRYQNALSEVDFILTGLTNEELKLIPDNFKEFIKENKSKYHKIDISLEKPLDEQNLSEETMAIIAIIYRKYLASPEEREILEKEFSEKLKKEKAEKANNIEKVEIKYENKVLDSEINETKEVLAIAKVEDKTWYEKIIGWIKNIFNK